MAKVITTELQHSGASGANITLDSSKNVTCENNLTVDGTTTLTGAVTLPDDTVDIADLSASGTASSSTFLRGDNSWASAGLDGVTTGSGNVTITDGNLIVASGHGIDFSATADESGSAASMDSELLDDYEEGEWTPDLTFSTSSTGISYSHRGGRYLKVGNLVHCSAYIFLNSKGSGSGYAEVSVPITPMNAAPSVTHAQGGFCTESGGWAANKTMVVLRVRGDASKAYVQLNESSTNHHTLSQIADFTDSTKMIMTFIYRST